MPFFGESIGILCPCSSGFVSDRKPPIRYADKLTDGLQFADKQTLTFASLMNIRQDIGLDLKSNQYSWCG